ncbi:hypothetical protein FACS189472_13850 [Alphaproteobacteria bacterium]|nr:hypothetical protein FACS189472_13850 [Alphaproteobacteria bacterium]
MTALSNPVVTSRAEIEHAFNAAYDYDDDEIDFDTYVRIKADVTNEALAMLAENRRVTEATVWLMTHHRCMDSV